MGSNFPYILLNEIETMFSQLAKQSWRHESVDSCIAHQQKLSSRCLCEMWWLLFSLFNDFFLIFISKPFNLENLLLGGRRF